MRLSPIRDELDCLEGPASGQETGFGRPRGLSPSLLALAGLF